MTAFKIPLALGAVAAAVATPAVSVDPGVALGASSTRITISGFVPVICHARVSADIVAAQPGTASLGELKEFCNSPRGYRVHADYSASLANARLIVDGAEVALPADGTAVISQSDHAAIDTRSLAIALPEGVEGGSLSFRIEPL
jgi:hypothetical protein